MDNAILSLSVIVPVFNRAAQLAEQLEALARQEYPGRWELIIADNGSTDDSIVVAKSFSDRLPLWILDAAGRPGKCFAVNYAVEHALGEGLVLLDSDDVVADGYLVAMGMALAESTFVGARLESERLNPAWLRERRQPLQERELPRLIGRRQVVIGAGMGVRTQAYREVGGLDEEMSSQEDLDLSWRLQDAGYRPVFVPDAMVHYRYRQDLRGIWNQERSYGRYEAMLYAKHRPADLSTALRIRRALSGWVAVLQAVPGMRTTSGRARLVTVTAAALGRAEGSVEAKVLYL